MSMKNIFSVCGYLALFLLLTVSRANGQQLPQFSQYMFNGLHVNPAYAGYKGEHYIQSSYRNQWGGLPGAPTTFTVTADLSANEGLMGFGASILSDAMGPAKTNSALLTYAYRIQTGRLLFWVSASAEAFLNMPSMVPFSTPMTLTILKYRRVG